MIQDIKKAPTEIIVDLDRYGCVIWTNSNEVFSLKGSCDEMAQRIRNLTTTTYVNDVTGERYMKQDMMIYIDKIPYGNYLKDILDNMGIKSEFVSNKSRLKGMTEKECVNVVSSDIYKSIVSGHCHTLK